MVTIQNQISILNKILLMKEHQERQINMMNESRKTPPGRQSRKSSSNLDNTVAMSNSTAINNDTLSNDMNSISSKTGEEKSSKSGISVGRGSEESNKKLDLTEKNEVLEPPKQTQSQSQCIVS